MEDLKEEMKKKPMAVRKTAPSKVHQASASTEAKTRENATSKGKAALKKTQSKLHTKRGKLHEHKAKNPSPSVKEASAKKTSKITRKRIVNEGKQKAADRAKLPKRESLASERLSSPAQSKDVKKGLGKSGPKKAQAKRLSNTAKTLNHIKTSTNLVGRAGIVGLAATAAAGVIKGVQQRKAKKIASEGVGGTKNMKKINAFRSKTPSKAYTTAKKKLKK